MPTLYFESVLESIIYVSVFLLFPLFAFILKKIPWYLINMLYLLKHNNKEYNSHPVS